MRMTVIEYIVPKKLASGLHCCAYVLLAAVNIMWIIYGTQLLELTKKAKMSATGWPMGITYFLFHDGFCGSYDPLPGAFSYTGGEYYGRWN